VRPTHHRAVVTALLAAAAAAQQQQQQQQRPDPVALVARAEKLLQKKEVEDAVLALWQALDELASRPPNAVHEATALSARFLLQQHDPRDAERRRVFASVAKQQVELATAYRLKKWLDVAASRLDVADRYDRDAGTKERVALDAARPKPKNATTEPAAPAAPAVVPCELLQRSNTQFVSGTWKIVGECLECCPAPGASLEWVTNGEHADHEIVVELRPADARKDHNAALCVGQRVLPGTSNFSGYCVHFSYDAAKDVYALMIWRIVGMNAEMIVHKWIKLPEAGGDGFRRLAIQVHGRSLRAQLDGGEPCEAVAPEDVRGVVGLQSGMTNSTTCAVQFRKLRIDPLPADAPSDEQLRDAAEAATQNAITKAVAEATELLKKQPEAAALRLRDALELVDDLPAGVLRDNLRKSVDALLVQADPLTPRRRKAAQAIASELGALADQYAAGKHVRAALMLAEHAAAFDPDGQSARRTAIEQQVQQWNVAQAAARANELLPPADDGQVLREWFASGRKLDTYTNAMVVDGAVARAESLAAQTFLGWLPQPLAPKLTKAGVHVRLAATAAAAGLCFDVVDATSFGAVTVDRRPQGLGLTVWRFTAKKWVPVAQRTIAMDAWRLDAWHPLTVESTPAGLVARSGDVEVKVPRASLGAPTGLFGLFASNGTRQPLTIELRAFRANP
jgi:hypothetical protein